MLSRATNTDHMHAIDHYSSKLLADNVPKHVKA